MRRPLRPRTSPLSGRIDRARKSRPGSVTLLAVFLFFTLTALGLGLAMLAGTYQRVGLFKARALRTGFAAENGVKQMFASLAEAAAGRASPVEISTGRWAELMEATAAGRADVAAEALAWAVPFERRGSAGEEFWESRLELALDRWEDKGDYLQAEIRADISAEGWLEGGARRKSASLGSMLEVLAGRIPLAAIPLLAAGPGGPDSLAELLAREKVEILATNPGRMGTPPCSTAAALIPADATPALAETLKVKIFSPDKLSRAELRRALGLEVVNEPVPDGVYLISNDAGLGGVFVQGDVEELLLAAEAGWQWARFRLEEGEWLLKFSPALGQTTFAGPAGERSFDRTPMPVIMVNGEIRSLGGGMVGLGETMTATTDPAVPSVVDGVSLTLVCSAEITITSHLVQEGVRWKDGLPYLRDSQSQLVIYANGQDFVDGTERSGKVKVGTNAPKDLQIQASIAARGGFSAESAAGDVTVAGSLQAGAVAAGPGKIKIAPDGRLSAEARAGVPSFAPKTTMPVLYCLSLEPLRWTE